MKCRLVFCVLALLVCVFVRADSWYFPPKLLAQSFVFGKSKIVLEKDGTRSPRWPPHTMSIYSDGKLVAKYQNVGFEHLYASKDNRFFAGLSNDGIPGTAFVLFDAEGNLLREVKHAYMPNAIYTEQSVTLVRKWFDAKRPVEFKMDRERPGRLDSILVWGTHGRQYDLLASDLKFSAAEGSPVELLEPDIKGDQSK